jgi:hypothetical protein
MKTLHFNVIAVQTGTSKLKSKPAPALEPEPNLLKVGVETRSYGSATLYISVRKSYPPPPNTKRYVFLLKICRCLQLTHPFFHYFLLIFCMYFTILTWVFLDSFLFLPFSFTSSTLLYFFTIWSSPQMMPFAFHVAPYLLLSWGCVPSHPLYLRPWA